MNEKKNCTPSSPHDTTRHELYRNENQPAVHNIYCKFDCDKSKVCSKLGHQADLILRRIVMGEMKGIVINGILPNKLAKQFDNFDCVVNGS